MTSIKLHLQSLELRDVPAVLQIVFDYRYDSTGFFNDPARRAELDRAASQFETRLNTDVDLAPLASGGQNSWTATTFHPSNPGSYVNVPNLRIGTDQVLIFAGGMSGVGGGEAGLGGYGGYSANGNQAWFDTLKNRGRGGFAPWGGSVSFSSTENWNFSSNAPAANQTDFYTVATHEIGHVLGFGVSTQWNDLVSGGTFRGANSRAVNGGTAPLLALNEQGHWQQGIKSQGNAVSMQPYVAAGTRVAFSELDFAALADIGWQINGLGNPAAVGPPVATAPIPSSPQLPQGAESLVIGGNGTFQYYTVVNGVPTAQGQPMTPFADYTGSIRTATGDFNGDGTKDIAVAAGPDSDPWVVVYDGRTGGEIRRFMAFEKGYTGGLNLAAGDIQGNGTAALVVGADRTGGPRVRIFAQGNPAWAMSDFFAIEDTSFSGGVRVAVGDVDGDGKADLLVSAGYGGGPRVSLYSGASLFPTNTPSRLIGDFFAFDRNVNNGAYVSLADFNGDGRADLVFGTGSGAARVRVLDGWKTITTGQPNASVLQDYDLSTAPGYDGGVRVKAGDFNGDGQIETAIATGTNQIGQVWLRSGTGALSTVGFGRGTLADGVFVG